MPIYEYQAREEGKACEYCRKGFELFRRIADPALQCCPRCGAAIVRLISASSIGSSKSGFDERAKKAGFSKFQRLGRGEYEKKY